MPILAEITIQNIYPPFLLFTAAYVDGWNASVVNSSESTVTLEWPKLNNVLGKQVRAYLALVENTRGVKVAGDLLFPNVTSKMIQGLNASNDYRVFAVAIDDLGQPHKSLQVFFSTTEGGEYLEDRLDERDLAWLPSPLPPPYELFALYQLIVK